MLGWEGRASLCNEEFLAQILGLFLQRLHLFLEVLVLLYYRVQVVHDYCLLQGSEDRELLVNLICGLRFLILVARSKVRICGNGGCSLFRGCDFDSLRNLGLLRLFFRSLACSIVMVVEIEAFSYFDRRRCGSSRVSSF